MKKILFILIYLLSFKAMAETQPTALFDLSDERIFGESIEQTFTGKPVVLIEKKDLPQKQVNKAEHLPLPDMSKNTLNIPIKTFFGHDRTAAFIDHTTDFLVIIQVLNDKTVRITEQIQFITSKENEKFKRFFPNKISGLDGKESSLKREFLSLKRDNAFVPFTTNEQENGTEITFDQPLPKGVHRMTLEYQVSEPFKINKSLAETVLPITGSKWGQITERFIVILSMPKKSHFYQKELLYGTNNQKIPENTKITEDGKGMLTFQNTHLIPAFTDIRLHLMSDASDLPRQGLGENINLNLIGIFTLILSGYVFLSILTARFKKWKKPLTRSKKINPILWAIEIGKDQNEDMDLIKKSGIRFAHTKTVWKKILTFLRFNMEYILSVICFILITKYLSMHYEIKISGLAYATLFLLSLAAILMIDYYGTRIQMKNLAEILKNALLNEPQGINLAKREIQTYYQIAICFGIHEVWKKRLIANNPSYKDLTCFKKEKK